jgi:uncharacterized membrane protein
LGAVVIGLGSWLYLRPQIALTSRERAILAALRASAVAVLVFCLARPVLVVASAIPQRNVVGILVDDSRSMRIPDVDHKPRGDYARRAFGGADSALYKSLAKRFQLRFFRTSGAGGRADDLGGLQYNGARSNLASALLRAEEELAGAPVAGMLLLSDGADNSADIPGATPMLEQLLALRARRVPVYTVGVGSERFEKDIELSRVEVPRVVLRDASLLLETMVTQRGFSGAKLPVMVEDSGRIVAAREITLPRDGEAALVRIRIPTTERGARMLRVRVPEQPGELVRENNERTALVVVRDRREKILYLEGEPRFELKFIRRAVESDENLQLVTLLRSAKEKFYRMSVDDSLELAVGFPKTREELFTYRGVVLGSIEASFFTVDQLRMLADFVSVRGGGLLVLGGRRALAEGGFAGTPLADALPIEIVQPGEFADSGAMEVTVVPTTAGAFHPATQIAPNDSATAQLWKTMPPLTMVNELGRAKPGATVLLEGDPSEGGRNRPVLIFQRYGRGKAIVFGVQDSWLWQMHSQVPVEDQSHETFWRQLLRWLASDVPQRLDVLGAEGGAVDEAIPIQAVVSDSAYLRANGASVRAEITAPSGTKTELPFEWTTDRDGEYRGALVPGENGVHEVRITGVIGKDTLRSEAAYVRVAEPTAEYFGAQLRRSLLTQFAEETGGRYYSVANAEKVAEDLVYSASGATVVEKKDLWDMPVLFLFLLGAVAVEWLYRRRRGLA